MRFQPTTYLATSGQIDLITSGLVFDFKAQDYVSGSLTWNATVGDYTASITGTVTQPLNYLSSSVGFNGNQWLKFSDNMTGSISSSNWEVYAYVSFTNAQTASAAFTPEFFSKGSGLTPSWNYAYEGGTAANAGYGEMGGGYPPGYLLDSLNASLRGSDKQLFAMSHISGAVTFPSYITVNYINNPGVIGSQAILNSSDYYVSFTGSAAADLLFGKGIDTGTQNISGSVIRLFGYNRILTAQERKNNWFALSGIYVK